MRSINNSTLYWTNVQHEAWNICLVATTKGVCYVESRSDTGEALTEWAARRFPGSPLVQDDARLQPYAIELIEYFRGDRKSFTAPLDLKGTSFQIAVWNALCEIPYGETWAYSDVAQRIERPSAVRAVGAAIGANPALVLVPCHRVIGKNGSLTGFREGLDLKRRLLELEGEYTPLFECSVLRA